MEITIKLTPSQVAAIDQLMETSHSLCFDDEVAKCLHYGIENRVYRSKYNKVQNQKRKEEGAELDSLRKLVAELKR
jgi:hypothetical protein